MNILFGAILLVILLLPGILFRIGYLALPFNSKGFKSTFLEELLISLIPAFVIQTTAYLITDRFIKTVDEKTLYLLLTNNDKTIGYNINEESIGLFFLYSLVVGIISVLLGIAVRNISLRTNLHLMLPFFRIYNEWQIYFEGFVLDYPDVPGRRSEVSQRWLDVLVETKDGSYLYTGLLHDYVITKDEKLDRIYLAFVRRRKLSSDEPQDQTDIAGLEVIDYSNSSDVDQKSDILADSLDKRYYVMPGDYFVIPGDEIKNINITYFSEQVTEDA